MSANEVPPVPLYNTGVHQHQEAMYRWAVELTKFLQSVSVQNLSITNIGTPDLNTTAAEYGDGYNHITVLTLSDVALGPIIAGTEGHGQKIYTFPDGVYMVSQSRSGG